MKWLENLFIKRAENILLKRKTEEQGLSIREQYRENYSMKQLGAQTLVKGSPEGEDRISFELSAAIGGRILNVRRYDHRRDSQETQTYVIPSGEDVGARVSKIINLELIK